MTAPHQCTRPGHGLRVLRAAMFAAVCVVLAAAGHALASLAVIPLWTLGVGFLGAAVLAVPLTGRERSLPGIVALLAVGQTALHTLFGLGQHTSAAASGAGSSAALSDAALTEHAARFVCGTTAAALGPAEARRILTDARVHPDLTGQAVAAHHPADALSTAAGSSAALLPSLSMLLGHVLAAVVAGWLLRRGDLALLRLTEIPALAAHTVADGALVRSLRGALALTRALCAGLPGAPRTGPALPGTALLAPPELRTTALQHTVVRRGPPAGVFALAA
ncbi:hypothetical protein AB0M97_26220 [Streptomyces sp. NPDC051207]|uniref:hypothetical protein n=1 Tax=Streptomyces sp. NPDC051207 TaxID=3154641 RepID=UPI00341F519E